jgi:hypothetical protein
MSNDLTNMNYKQSPDCNLGPVCVQINQIVSSMATLNVNKIIEMHMLDGYLWLCVIY